MRTLDVSADQVWRLVDGHATYWAVAAALDAGVIDALADGTSGALPVDVHRLRPLLAVLADAGIVDDDGRLTPLGGLVRAMRGLVAGSPGRHENWLALGDVLRGGEPPAPVDDDAAFRAALALATREIQRELAGRTAERLPVPRSAAADGPSAAAWLEGLGITAGEPPHDVVVLAHACRELSPGDAAALVADAAARTAPGGRVVVADYFTDAADPDRARRSNVLGLTMVANTRAGTAYAAAEVARWLTAAGLVDVELVDGRPAPHDVLIARKPTEHEGSAHARG